MLSRLRMTVDDCIFEYENLAGRVFGHPRLFHQTNLPTFWPNRPKYDAKAFQAVISGPRGVTNRRGEVCADNDRLSFRTGVNTCRAFGPPPIE